MHDDNQEYIGTFTGLFLDQVDAVLAVISRAVVQRQILVFILVLGLS